MNTMRDEHIFQDSKPQKVRIAVFDFDGTCIEGSSPEMLVRYLVRNRKLSAGAMAHIAFWALRYVLHLPQSERKVRGRVFSVFAGKPVAEVDAFLAQFYKEQILPLWRPKALEQIKLLREQGVVILAVSATFEPIIRCALQSNHFDYQVSTVMQVTPDGRYTAEVEGEPVEGAYKIAALNEFADRQFGADNWELSYCFADHYSDIDVLSRAKTPIAVSPDATLRRCAKRHGWAIVQWEKEA